MLQDDYSWWTAGEVFLLGDLPKKRFVAYDPKTVTLSSLTPEQARIVIDNLDRLNSQKSTPTPFPGCAPGPAPLLPSEIICIIPSFACNMACRYCYNSETQKEVFLSEDIARRAIDTLVKNTLSSGNNTCHVFFHGGEPFHGKNFDLIQSVVHYAKNNPGFSDVYFRFYIPTNGTLSPEQVKWSIENLTSIAVSLDGPPAVQDQYRRRLRGVEAPDFAALAGAFEAGQLEYIFRATLGQETVCSLPETVDYMCRISNNEWHQISLVWPTPTTSHGADLAEFQEQFREGVAIARSHGKEIRLFKNSSFCKPRKNHCLMLDKSFVLLPTGDVSACFEVNSVEEGQDNPFIIAHFDAAQDDFVFYEGRVNLLRQRNNRLPHLCTSCFAYGYCAGQCPHRTLKTTQSLCLSPTQDSCALIRNLMADDLLFQAEKVQAN